MTELYIVCRPRGDILNVKMLSQLRPNKADVLNCQYMLLI
jgi:hypothetical protein